ncbi:hypothetical protein GCM10009557_02270 [Virgisporangium ochraceum]|uniref:Uncharacterized protein n=1 Tax=Virgisporangium ochraceum TaxID=65505 RepID=A0A8J4A2B0_9ACTN|nr:hypothetical protein [Virgisporangium ochraceum]GIJ72848.1 hypothetical protein Voc01_077650 [Virgisporangium ochraceum]
MDEVEPETLLVFRPAARDPSWRPGWDPIIVGEQPVRLEDLGQSAFIWRNFRVQAEFRLGGADFSESGVPVCVLDFALMLQAARAILREDGAAALELSDRVGEWVFDRQEGDDRVRLRRRYRLRDGYRYRAADGSCPLEAFDGLVDRSLTDALSLIFSAQPALRRNPYLRRLAAESGHPDPG